MLAAAVLCVAHARLAERRQCVLNEKRLVRRAGRALLAAPGASSAELAGTVAAAGYAPGTEPLARG